MLELRLQNINLTWIYDSVSFDYSDFISSLYDAVPDLRILEIGAGIEATTEFILHTLYCSVKPIFHNMPNTPL